MQTFEQENADQIPASANEKEVSAGEVSFPTPDNPPWNILAGLGVWGASLLFILVFQLFVLFLYLAKQKVDLADNAALSEFIKTDSTVLLLGVISTFPAHLCTLALAWLVATRNRKFSFRQTLGWEMNGYKIWHSFVIVALFMVVSFVLTRIFGEPDNEFLQMLKNSRAVVFPMAFLAVFTAPIVEEVVYRGILYSPLQRRLGVVWAVVIVTFLFGLVHVPQYSKNFVPDFPTVSLLFLLSLTLTLIRVYTKNLLPCIILHTIFNAFQASILILEPYLPQETKTEPAAFIFHFLK